jgi:hypothetical protein
MEVEDRWSNISKMLDYTQFEALGAIVFLILKISKLLGWHPILGPSTCQAGMMTIRPPVKC